MPREQAVAWVISTRKGGGRGSPRKSLASTSGQDQESRLAPGQFPNQALSLEAARLGGHLGASSARLWGSCWGRVWGGGAKADSGTPAGENRDSPKGHGLPSLAAGAKGLLLTMLALKAYRCQLPAWDARTPGQPPLLSPLHAHRPWGGVGGLPGWGGPAFNHSLAGLLSALSRVPDDGPRGKNSARVPSLPHVGFCFCGTQINTHTC